mgnify:CR=1 FL=1
MPDKKVQDGLRVVIFALKFKLVLKLRVLGN